MVDDPAWDGAAGNVSGLPSLDWAQRIEPATPGAAAGCDGLAIALLAL